MRNTWTGHPPSQAEYRGNPIIWSRRFKGATVWEKQAARKTKITLPQASIPGPVLFFAVSHGGKKHTLQQCTACPKGMRYIKA